VGLPDGAADLYTLGIADGRLEGMDEGATEGGWVGAMQALSNEIHRLLLIDNLTNTPSQTESLKSILLPHPVFDACSIPLLKRSYTAGPVVPAILFIKMFPSNSVKEK
jgi:hypothetical protein